jgi:peptide/nickel transport system ATP-binding protein
MIFQDPLSAMHPYYTVGDQLIEAYRVHNKVSKKAARARAIEMLDRVGIPQPSRRVDDYPHQFSGGMRQRAMIAMGLINNPGLLIADEPTTALDVTVQAQILDLLQDQRRDRNMSLILVTHDLGVVAGHTDEIAVMYAGKVVEKAPTRVLFERMKMPYTEALLESIPKIDEPSHTRLRVIPGRPPDLVRPPQGCRFAPRCPYAQERCVAEEPPLAEAETPGHTYACWYPVGSPEQQEIKARLVEQRLATTAGGAG